MHGTLPLGGSGGTCMPLSSTCMPLSSTCNMPATLPVPPQLLCALGPREARAHQEARVGNERIKKTTLDATSASSSESGQRSDKTVKTSGLQAHTQ